MRRAVRLVSAVILLASAAVVVQGALSAPTTASPETVPDAPPTENVTVVTESARFGTIVAWHPNGSLLYYNDTRTKYFDVDPVAGESLTVEYAATDTIHTRGPTCSSPPCTRNVVERVNLSTGETREVYARYDPEEAAAEWHDHERIDESRILVADIVHDQVFVVNTTTGIVTWRWDTQSDFPVEGGGPYPGDWAHINDVELLDDGRVMVSMRNQDQVVFLDRQTGLLANWTLGSEDDHDVLYEQHNPDYIPAERGGPAVVVADSENGRIVEYQRDGDGWERTWQWSDARLQWPRDADRLPGGTTLVTDTHGKRVVEVDRDGRPVWSVPVPHPYDAERLATGPESATGESASRLGLTSWTASGSGPDGGFDVADAVSDALLSVFPSRIVNAVFYVAPVWMGGPQLVAVIAGVLTTLGWAALELFWRLPDFGVRLPVYRK
jgi:hypothetical protein